MERLSEAPIRVNMESSTRIRALCAGTIDPIYAATNLLSLQPQQDPKRNDKGLPTSRGAATLLASMMFQIKAYHS